MSGIPGAGADAALARLHSRLGASVTVTGAGLTAASRLAVISNAPGDAFQGAGRTMRRVTFHFRRADLPAAPTKTMTITDGSATVWRAIDIINRGDVDGWDVVAERA